MNRRPALRICSYEDRLEAMDSVILMGESLCRVDPEVSLQLTLPHAPESVRAWAANRPQVELCTTPPPGVTGWDVKPWLLLRELDAGQPQAVWLDTDIIVTRPITTLLDEFPRDLFLVTEEWNGAPAVPSSEFWGMPSGRSMWSINACFIRATPAHRPVLERYLQMTKDPRYRAVQTLPLERRPIPMLSDTNALIALLESKEFSHVRFDYLRMGRHIAQCAGSSGYRAHHRFLDLFRGLPALIHGIGRKPWTPQKNRGRLERYLLDLATDVSPYVLASRKIARKLDCGASWLEPRTSLGAVLRRLGGYHPGLAGLPLAVLHGCQQQFGRAVAWLRRPSASIPLTQGMPSGAERMMTVQFSLQKDQERAGQ